MIWSLPRFSSFTCSTEPFISALKSLYFLVSVPPTLDTPSCPRTLPYVSSAWILLLLPSSYRKLLVVVQNPTELLLQGKLSLNIPLSRGSYTRF